jgi:hypothetical protein
MNFITSYASAILAILAISLVQVNAQIRYSSADERRDAGMGVERVARFFTPAYESTVAKTDDEVRWIQIDLGGKKRIDGIKLLPKVVPWGGLRYQMILISSHRSCT